MGLIIGVSRYILVVIAFIILAKCILTLLLGSVKDKTYGYIIDNKNNKRYELNMWETSIGKSNSCDIVLPYGEISRFHAVICRRNDSWYIYDLLSKNPTKVNSEVLEKKNEIENLDVISLSGHKFTFRIIDDPVQREKKRRFKVRKSQSSKKKVDDELEREDTTNDFSFDQRDTTNVFSDDQKDELPIYRRKTDEFDAGRNFSNSNDIYSNGTRDTAPDEAVEKTFVDTTKSVDEDGIINLSSKHKAKLFINSRKSYFYLTEEEIIIGRSKACDLRLDVPSINNVHAIIVLYEDGWAIENLSNNKTYLNSKFVNGPQLLFNLDEIKVGDETLIFMIEK